MNLKKSLFVAALAGISLTSFASIQVQRTGDFVSRPGYLEFSGQMIVRPLQPAALTAAGKGQLEQVVIRSRASQRVQGLVKEYVRATDEYIVRIPAGYNENSYSIALMRTGDYQYVEPNWICYPLLNPNDPQFPSQWHHGKVQSAQAWDLITGLSTITVAVVDTGIDLTHPDLAPNRVPGYNSIDNLAEVNGGQVNDLNGHGTHVAGDAAAIGNNAVGVCGMGWNFRIMMVRTSNSPSGSAPISDITEGARWAADNGAKVVSASYSGVDSAAVGTSGTYIKGVGSLFLYSAGNDNRNLTGFNWPDTIVVGATTSSDAKASFSAYGPGVHVFAPGVNILSTTLGGGYGGASGTSMSAPVANGAVALIFAANPTLTAQQAQDILENNCDNIGPSSIFSKGRINQFKNVNAAQTLNPIIEEPTSIVTVYGTHVSGTLADILVPNTGGPSYDVQSVLPSRSLSMAGVELSYDIDSFSNLISLAFTYEARVQPELIVTGFAYVWNYNTAQYENLGQFTMTGSSTWTSKTYTVSSNPGRFVGPGGEIKTLVRALSNVQGGRNMAQPFLFKFGHAKLKVVGQP